MADLHEDDDNHDVPPSISPENNNLHLSSSQDSFHRPIVPPIDRQNQVTHQSQPHFDHLRVIEENDEFEPHFEPGSELGLLLQNSGSNSSQLSGLRIIDIGSDSEETRENEADDEDASFPFRWDVDDEIPNPNSNLNAYEDFEWEEVDDDDDDDALVSPVLLTAFEEPSEEPEWQVLSNVHNFDPDPEDQYEDHNYTEYQMFFADGYAPLSGRPPASKTVVDNLSTVILSQQHVCAVCKDEVVVGELVTQLPCGHGYHGGCILPWLAVRNTCPVCRHELPTDDADYESRRVQRGGNA